ncbi:unnamed protein product [Cuscuta europaea]|uniref:Bromo domain-containing protein n=1 Tax=Cuscuta europaea TaxID=41803 RepID=A0A9P1EFX4_CUSEU|nr:unnamed protein product [Cuscuta europaea]
MRKDGECKSQKRRNSPRLLALNVNKETQERKRFVSDETDEKEESKGEKPSLHSLARVRGKRKFPYLAAKQVSEGRSKVEKHENSSTNSGVQTKLPEKCLLELILDILQRRDAYEIFAEPVDPDEVENYNDIIKEPMDFGTMRAKLHEGLYENLEQFEHDAFLIPENAMHFNSSSTIYFRQARCINDLAKKVFHVLRTNPQNLEMEFAGSRRRSMRKMKNETKEPEPSPQKDVKANNASNNTLFSFGEPSTLTGINKGSQRFAQTNNKGRVYFQGSNNEDSRRSTYITWKSFIGNDCPKTTILSNELNMNYKESLMRFVEDLGPTAKRIAAMRLQALHLYTPTFRSPSYQVPTSYATFRMTSFLDMNSAAATSNPQIGLHVFTKETKDTTKDTSRADIDSNQLKDSNNPVGSMLQYKRNRKASEAANKCGSSNLSGKQVDSPSPIVNPSADLNSSPLEKLSGSSKSSVDEQLQKAGGSSVIVDTRKPNDRNTRPIVLALEQSYSPKTPTELKMRNKGNKAKQRNKQPMLPTPSDKADGLISEAYMTAPVALPPKPLLGSRFTFDLAFLRARLNHMNSVADKDFGQQSSYDPSSRVTVGDIEHRSLYDQSSGINLGGFGQRSFYEHSSRHGSLTSLLNSKDEHQQETSVRPLIHRSNNNYQPSWHSSTPPLDYNLSLQL